MPTFFFPCVFLHRQGIGVGVGGRVICRRRFRHPFFFFFRIVSGEVLAEAATKIPGDGGRGRGKGRETIPNATLTSLTLE